VKDVMHKIEHGRELSGINSGKTEIDENARILDNHTNV
jgi:hypothetical protein